MTGIKIAPGRYERVNIDGGSYYVCAECRLPMKLGHQTIYELPIPNKGLPGPSDPEQALCDPCYRAQYKRVYPQAPPIIPQSPDFLPLAGTAPVPWDHLDAVPVTVARSDNEVFELAIKLVRRRNDPGVDQFAQMKQVYERLKGLPHADLELMFADSVGEVTITQIPQ